MINSKRGTIAIYLFMLFVVFVILGIALSKPLTDSIGETRNSTEIDCPNAISYQDKAICGQLDTFPFFYVALTFGLGATILKALGK